MKKENLIRTLQQSFCTAAVLALALPVPAFADGDVTLASIAENLVGKQLAILPDFISAICYLSGIFFIAMGVLALKEHAEDPRTKLSAGIGKLAGGAALVALPVVTTLVMKTLSLSGSSTNGVAFHGFGVVTK